MLLNGFLGHLFHAWGQLKRLLFSAESFKNSVSQQRQVIRFFKYFGIRTGRQSAFACFLVNQNKATLVGSGIRLQFTHGDGQSIITRDGLV